MRCLCAVITIYLIHLWVQSQSSFLSCHITLITKFWITGVKHMKTIVCVEMSSSHINAAGDWNLLDVTLCSWLSSCWCLTIIVPSPGRSSNPRRLLKMDSLTILKMKALCSFKTPGNTHPTTVSHPWSLWLSVLCSQGTHNYTQTHTHIHTQSKWQIGYMTYNC
jgi:hypothetical protein